MPTNKPCAYCGSTDTPRHNGHVISKSLYPSSTPNHIQRPTRPECEDCQQLWPDAETQFRNILIVAGEPNAAVRETWDKVHRSFYKPSGRKWVLDVYNEMIPVSMESGQRYVVYPYKDANVNLVLRKIARGLSSWHDLGETIQDEHVWAGYVPGSLPGELRTEMLHYSLGDEFVKYGYMLFEDEFEIRSGWLIRFYGSRDFLCIIAKSEAVKQRLGQQLDPSPTQSDGSNNQ